MRRTRRQRRRLSTAGAALALTLAAIAVIAVLSSSSSHERQAVVHPKPPPPGTHVLTVYPSAESRPVPPGFVGLSLEYPAVTAYAGQNPELLEQLIRNLAPGQRPVLRIGGDSTDWTWWPVAGMTRPPGIRVTLGERWLQDARTIADAVNARIILGINLEAGSPALAAAEARALTDGIGPSRIEALELGNEPELYGTFGWYRAPDGREVLGRPSAYDFAAFTEDFSRVAESLPHVPLAGPTTGYLPWMRPLDQFLTAEPRVSVATLHRYPLRRCYTEPGAPAYPTIGHLLSAASARGLADSVARYAAIAHAHGLPLRIDEMNSVACGNAPRVSNTFASALWAINAMFQMARVGVDGVNIHTFPGAAYAPFNLSGGRAFVDAEYYGLLMFAQAAPAGSRLLEVSGVRPNRTQVWATRAPDRAVRVVVVNESATHPQLVAVRTPAQSGTATLERLQAPGLDANNGVTLGGQSFAARTATGLLAGTPHTTTIATVQGEYVVSLPPASAAMLTLARARSLP